MVFILENIYKEIEDIRAEYPATSNYPLVCPSCANPLGILHSDPISESIYLHPPVLKKSRPSLSEGRVECVCGKKLELQPYVASEGCDTKNFPTEKETKLEVLAQRRKTEIERAERFWIGTIGDVE